jgi:SAM-dependent methyltransferase
MNLAEARCPACHADRWTEVAPEDSTYTLHRCQQCGTYRIHPDKVDPALLYRDYYGGADAKRLTGIFDRIWRSRRQQKAAQILEGAPAGARVLDVGCERGELLNVLKEAGCAVAGTQLSQAAAGFAREHFGIDVFVGELQDAPFEPGSFDVILMINVLEHLPDPESYLRRVAELLKPGGIFWVELPNAGSFTAALSEKRWLHHDPPHHYWGFTPTGLRTMLDRHSFDVERIHHVSWEHGPIGCLQSWLNFLPGPRNVIFEIVRKGLSRKPGRVALQLLHVLLGGVLLPLAVVTATVESLSGNGQVVLTRLRRRC